MAMTFVEHLYVPDSPRSRGRKRKPPGPEFQRVADALRAIRADHKLTQEQMADVLGLTFAGYRPYETGRRDLTQSQIERIATELGVSVSEITRRLWPDDAVLTETRYSLDFDELQRQVADLPPEQAERVLRGFRQSLEIAYGAAPVVRRN